MKRRTLLLAAIFTATGAVPALADVVAIRTPGTKDFVEIEWNCHCPICLWQIPHKMQPHVQGHVQRLRDHMAQPLFLVSAYRCAQHPVEVKKTKPGQHNAGLAVDVQVTSGAMAAEIIAFAITELGVKGWAYSKRLGFVHLDWREGVRVTWEY